LPYKIDTESMAQLAVGRIGWLDGAGITGSGKVVAKDGRKSEGDYHNGSRTYHQEASGPTGVLAASHV
jgi:hypothetical protein